MLKRLELIGFKSFADRTRFDFAPGVTAVVGPNGSGKSNIIDAVKWILGEQSAKSLRGGEMTDVIFNGSSNRKSVGLAEVTMTFDNAKRQLRFDGDEVELTRRVYRDGQGEYLINGTIARLKDIKEMFLGSGAGQGAYSIIEQGRVDALLVASNKDRRQIFEEAAGISRFRAKKTEALRKLENVDADLNRVRDLLQELEKNLKTLGNQAGKAQKYQSLHTRFKELRIGLGLHETRELQDKLRVQDGVLTQLHATASEATQASQADEQAVAQLDQLLTQLDRTIATHEAELTLARNKIAENEAIANSQREQLEQLESRELGHATEFAKLLLKVRALRAEVVQSGSAVASCQDAVALAEEAAKNATRARDEITEAIDQIGTRLQTNRDALYTVASDAATHHSHAAMQRAAAERLSAEQTRKQAESERSRAAADAIDRALSELSQSDHDVQQRLSESRTAVQKLHLRQTELQEQADAFDPIVSQRRDERSMLRGREETLANLERDRDGIGAGVRAVLDHLESNPEPAVVVGMVADLLTVPNEVAPLVECLLGPLTEHFVLAPGVAVDDALTRFARVPGRVGVLPYPTDNSMSADDPTTDTTVSVATIVSADIPGLVQNLLGNAYFSANRFSAASWLRVRPGCRVITRAGELYEPDGSIVFGRMQAGGGLVSRKSELRELRIRIAEAESHIATIQSEQERLRAEIELLIAPRATIEAEIATLSGEAGTLRDRTIEQREKHSKLVELCELARHEALMLAKEIEKARAAFTIAEAAAIAADANTVELRSRIQSDDAEHSRLQNALEQALSAYTAAQVGFSRATQDCQTAVDRLASLANEQSAHSETVGKFLQAERQTRARRIETSLRILNATSSAATAYLVKDQAELAIRQLRADRKTTHTRRAAILTNLTTRRERWQQQHEEILAHELTVRDLRNRLQTISTRLHDDYQLDVVMLLNDENTLVNKAELNIEATTKELEELRHTLAKLGSVNLEALEQLATAQSREATIRKEYNDLTRAEDSLLKIIEQINADSSRLFTDTVNTVRVHFQELFRKLFNGGHADIILEDPTDVLETGIEITARPPGKEVRSISLMSGGEKTLTAVALLLAMFRSKPSPFCLLDEVDAALDEANTGRLADVIQSFRNESQFIIITHKKRSMVIADVLHGVTMQESGVSKQVATRIDDWPDEQAAPRQAA